MPKPSLRQKLKLWWKDFWVIEDIFSDEYEWDDSEGTKNFTSPPPINRPPKHNSHGRTDKSENPTDHIMKQKLKCSRREAALTFGIQKVAAAKRIRGLFS